MHWWENYVLSGNQTQHSTFLKWIRSLSFYENCISFVVVVDHHHYYFHHLFLYLVQLSFSKNGNDKRLSMSDTSKMCLTYVHSNVFDCICQTPFFLIFFLARCHANNMNILYSFFLELCTGTGHKHIMRKCHFSRLKHHYIYQKRRPIESTKLKFKYVCTMRKPKKNKINVL